MAATSFDAVDDPPPLVPCGPAVPRAVVREEADAEGPHGGLVRRPVEARSWRPVQLEDGEPVGVAPLGRGDDPAAVDGHGDESLGHAQTLAIPHPFAAITHAGAIMHAGAIKVHAGAIMWPCVPEDGRTPLGVSGASVQFSVRPA